MARSIIASIIIALLTVYSISVVIAYFYNISVTFPFSISNGSYVPEHRLKAMRLSLFLTFIFFSFYYFFYGSKKFYPIQIIAVMIFNLTIVGTLVFAIEGAKATEFLQLLFYAPASLILYNATRPNLKNIFKKR